MTHHSSYMSQIFYPNQLKAKINAAAKVLKEHKEIKAIACTGVSGLSFASALSVKTGLPLVIVRKESDQSHSDYIGNVETNSSWYLRSYKNSAKIAYYCIVDDLISTGTTVKRIMSTVHAKLWEVCIPFLRQDRKEPLCNLIILYHDGDYNPKTEFMGIKIIYV